MMKFKRGKDIDIDEVVKYVVEHHPELKDDDIEFALANLVVEVLDGMFVPGKDFILFNPETYGPDVINRIKELAHKTDEVVDPPKAFGGEVVNFR